MGASLGPLGGGVWGLLGNGDYWGVILCFSGGVRLFGHCSVGLGIARFSQDSSENLRSRYQKLNEKSSKIFPIIEQNIFRPPPIERNRAALMSKRRTCWFSPLPPNKMLNALASIFSRQRQPSPLASNHGLQKSQVVFL